MSLCDRQGKKIGQRKFDHGGTGLNDIIDWLLRRPVANPRLCLANWLRDQLWRYYPQMLELGDLDEDWMLDPWETAPTPEKAARASTANMTAPSQF